MKLSLAVWRAQLRSRNVKATEKGIIEVLVRASDVDQVAALLVTAAESGPIARAAAPYTIATKSRMEKRKRSDITLATKRSRRK